MSEREGALIGIASFLIGLVLGFMLLAAVTPGQCHTCGSHHYNYEPHAQTWAKP